MKRNKGITLIALVVTIIVLLILAGVTISLILGQQGIFSKAADAKINNEIAQEKEAIKLAMLTLKTDKLTNTQAIDKSISPLELKEEMKKGEPIPSEVTAGSEEGLIKVTYPTGRSYEVDGSGNVVQLGENIPTDPAFDAEKGINIPKIISGLQPIKYEETTEQNTTVEDPDWYNYALNTGDFGQDNQNNRQAKWANAKTENGSYVVWIPRYAYKILSNEHKMQPGEIDIIFLQGTTNKDKRGNNIPEGYIVHPAFTLGNKQLEGIWVGKYETSNDGSGKVKIVPNQPSYRNLTVSSAFDKAQAMAGENSLSNADSHLMKNVEWGAVAYLAQSKYGRNGVEVRINNNNGGYTGWGATERNQASVSYSASSQDNLYTGPYGQLASTTGNITGIYDMSGGSYEYVMGMLDGEKGSSGYTNLPDSMYCDIYEKSAKPTSFISNYSQNSGKKGDAIYETSSLGGTVVSSWYDDYCTFVNVSYPWFVRGDYYDNNSYTGLFAYDSATGEANSYYSFRVVMSI